MQNTRRFARPWTWLNFRHSRPAFLHHPGLGSHGIWVGITIEKCLNDWRRPVRREPLAPMETDRTHESRSFHRLQRPAARVSRATDVLMVSPKRRNRGSFEPMTPATMEPVCMPWDAKVCQEEQWPHWLHLQYPWKPAASGVSTHFEAYSHLLTSFHFYLFHGQDLCSSLPRLQWSLKKSTMIKWYQIIYCAILAPQCNLPHPTFSSLLRSTLWSMFCSSMVTPQLHFVML